NPSGPGAFKGCIWKIASFTSSAENRLEQSSLCSSVSLPRTTSQVLSTFTGSDVEKISAK
ncbi:hypothetical protein A2U01_0055146, partial [Trifolium medium]|nr:hypothetical protein [Trifolium medium]